MIPFASVFTKQNKQFPKAEPWVALYQLAKRIDDFTVIAPLRLVALDRSAKADQPTRPSFTRSMRRYRVVGEPAACTSL